MPTLRNWSVCTHAKNPYQAPELGVSVLRGIVFDGMFVRTSEIIGKRGDKVVTRSGSEYTLSDVDPVYERQFPDARKRLFDQLREV